MSPAEREPLRPYCVAATWDDRLRASEPPPSMRRASVTLRPSAVGPVDVRTSVPLTLTPPSRKRLVGYLGSILQLLFTVGMTWRAQTTAAPAKHKAPVPGLRLLRTLYLPRGPVACHARRLWAQKPGLFSLRSNYVSVPQSRAAIGWN